MKFEIDHLTRYRYSRPVTLDPHVLRLIPRCDTHQRLLSSSISINPEPIRHREFIDAWGNAASRVLFSGELDLLEIRMQMEVTTFFKGLELDDESEGSLEIPMDYGSESAALNPYLELIDPESILMQFTRDLVQQSRGGVLSLLASLNDRVAEFHQQDIRLDGYAQSPSETLRSEAGVCRDLAVLFIAACRQLGIAARFVSGYQMRPATSNRDKRYLHAWAEVYLPEIGWVGYDQTHADIVRDKHVVVAAGAAQIATMPVEGGFRFSGEALENSLETDIRITVS